MSITFEEMREIAWRTSAPRETFDPATLRARRKRAGVTATEVAMALGCQERAVTRWEAGSRKPHHPMLQQVERILAALANTDDAA